MPIVDGLASTKMIRAFEHVAKNDGLSVVATTNGRIPVFAVSASLVEREKDVYVDAGFDGWILKPVDFKRLEMLLQGIMDDGVRNRALYTPGQWEQGGWFRRRIDLPSPDKADPTKSLPVNSLRDHLRAVA
jgi:CheY-like chemotaxis protein